MYFSTKQMGPNELEDASIKHQVQAQRRWRSITPDSLVTKYEITTA